MAIYILENGVIGIQVFKYHPIKKALSPIRVDEILVMRREPSAGAGFGRRRRRPSVRGRQHVQVTEP